MATCAVPECERRGGTRGLCGPCYSRARRKGRLDDYPATLVRHGASLDERLRHLGWDVAESGCWIWRGSLNAGGYGQLAVGGDRPEIASRAAYAAWVTPLVDGDVVCHRCDNPPCINPDHLFVGDRGTNNRDAASKRRTANGELKTSSKLTDDEVAEMRATYAAGGINQRDLARRYGVCQQLVSSIVRGKRRAQPTNWR